MKAGKATRNALPEDRPIHVALVDDHLIVVEAMASLLEVMPGHKLVHAATNAEDFFRGLRAHEEVDVALVDLQMPGIDGFAVLERLRAERPEIHCLAFTFNNDPEWVRKAIRQGARGYVLKNTGHQELRAAIHELLTTGYHRTDLMNDSLSDEHVSDHSNGARTSRAIDRDKLPRREREFLEHLLRPGDATYAEIADLMGVSRSAVDGYVRYFGEHYDAHSRAEIVKLALPPPPPRRSAITNASAVSHGSRHGNSGN